MALTNGHDVFAALHETGVNKFIHNVFAARRYYFHFAVPPLGGGVAGTDFTILPPLPVPGTNYGLAYSIEMSQPVIDFTPQNVLPTLPAPLHLGANQFSLVANVQICLLCGFHIPIRDPNPRDPNGKEPGRGQHPEGDKEQHRELVCTRLEVWAIGHPTVANLGSVNKLIGLAIDDIVVKDVGALEKILECIAEDAVNALLEKIRFTLKQIALGAFPVGLILEDGPKIADDQLETWAKVV